MPGFLRLPALFVCSAMLLFAAPPAIQEKTAGMKAMPGLLPLYWDEAQGKLWMEIGRWNQDLLYYTSLPHGIGSNDIGLDRGKLGEEMVVRFERTGPKVFLVQRNLRFRSSSPSPAERRSVEEAFARSVIWGFETAAATGDRVLVDATPFFLRDGWGVSPTLKSLKQGTFSVDASRSAIVPARTRVFPKNTEAEAMLTFTGSEPGGMLQSVAPSPTSVTVHQHHSFVELPEGGYTPRAFDPRSGFFPAATWADYSMPLGEPMRKLVIGRHRLQKKNPSAAVSEAVEPIVYYLDPGTPEPFRTALLEGARWWTQAFEAAGFRDAFRVELLPEDADPMDIRYNTIQWVHRSTRGWSYGSSVTDPRTGEILKGHVTLGSLRVRQDYMIAEGLLAPWEDGKPVSPEVEKMVLARLRQLSAHEVGHTLGLAHNYAASISDRASVMDYPHPLALEGTSGVPDLSRAYTTGVGPWDVVSVRWGYGEIPPGQDERSTLDSILKDAAGRGLRFLTDADARPEGSLHPGAHLWDNGADPAAELERILRVRGQALARFGENVIRPGAPLSSLEDVLVPLYLAHRYQTEAAAKVIGGLDYEYALRGSRNLVTRMIPGPEQKRALDAVLKTIDPAVLTLSEPLLRLLPPRAFGYDRTRENFRGRTGLAFDAVAPAEAAANLSLRLLLHPERAARLLQYSARDTSIPTPGAVMDAVLAKTLLAPSPSGLPGAVSRAVDGVALYHLMSLASAEAAPLEVRAAAWERLRKVEGAGKTGSSHLRFASELIERFRRDPKQIPIPAPPEAPPGQPI